MQLSRLTAIGAGVTAFLGSCCALPLMLLGLTGTIGFASAFVPYQKYFTVATFALLGTAFYLVYGRKPTTCENPNLCNPKTQGITKWILWISTLLAIIFLIGPYLIAKFMR
ncbi:MAG: mercury transporter MerT [Deltaproteobacteria bacterium]|nr:mercury transporter MerT [Deltaproteobacteria bacterium]